jgi:hypothetical protein
MILSQREKLIALAAVVTVAVLFLDWYVLTPVLDRRAALVAERQALAAELAEAQALFRRQRLLSRTWRQMLDSGMTTGLASAESQVLHALRDWSQDSRLTLSSVKPGKVVERGDLLEMSFQAAGTGSMRGVARFLWHVETASLPIRIQQLQLGARTEGADDLSLQLSLSALCLPADGERATDKEER